MEEYTKEQLIEMIVSCILIWNLGFLLREVAPLTSDELVKVLRLKALEKPTESPNVDFPKNVSNAVKITSEWVKNQ